MQNNAASTTVRRVLIVDDDLGYAESLADLLALQGYEALVADRPEAATDALKWVDLAVVMLDVRLRLESGVDFLSRLKAERPDLICVMMTAHVDTQSAIKALRRGAYDYCDKSCEPSELYAVLERCFEWRQLQEERRAAYEALRIAKEEAEASQAQAEAANQAKSEFLATMSHELRTPLNAVIGFSQLMLSETLGPMGQPQYKEYAKDINDSGMHLLGIINDILDLSKAEAGKLVLEEGWVDLAEVIDATCRLIRPRAERMGLSVKATLCAQLPPLLADERKLKQVLLNVVSNAVKFTPAGGYIEIAANLDPTRGYCVTVEDTGIGIAPEDLDRVLEPFVQVENAFTRSHQGSGLGLPLAAKMTELHGGRLSIESTLGKGTRVSLTIPMARAAQLSQAI